jgi:predicted RecA/RadA family phage recombinase
VSYLPLYLPGDRANITAEAPIAAGQLVTALAAPAGADDATVVGVASKDAAEGETIALFHGGVQRLVAADPIARGDLLKPADDGEVTVYVAGTDAPELFIGIALAAAAEDAIVPAKFLR